MAKKRKNRHPRLVGVIHLPALAGAPGASDLAAWQALDRAGSAAVREAQAFARAGFDAVILENFGDVPFYGENVPPETVASLAVISAAVRESTKLRVGINVLRNDARAALAIASVCGLTMIRVNVLSGVAASDQGWLTGSAAELLRERKRLGSEVEIWADVHVKHAQTLSSLDLETAIHDAVMRGGADAVIVSGARTGVAMDIPAAVRAAKIARECGVPCYSGSGVTAQTAAAWSKAVDGVIVSSSLRQGGHAGRALEAKRLSSFVTEFRRRKAAGR